MELKTYTGITFTITFVPAFVVFIIGSIVWYHYRKSECLMLIIMKGIVSKRNIDRRPTYLVCNRKLPPSSRHHFMLGSIFITAICIQCFFLLSTVEVNYECSHDPSLDCFKKKDNVKFSDALAYDESPVNCSSISTDDFVMCYRITVLDPQKAFIGAAAGYLLFKFLNFGFLILSYTMIFVAKKWEAITLKWFQFVFGLILTIVLFIPFTLRIYLNEVESAFRKISFTVLVQLLLVFIALLYFMAWLPWKEFAHSKEYFEEATLPNVAAYDNEMASTRNNEN